MYTDTLTQGIAVSDESSSVVELDDIIGELEMKIPTAGAAMGTCSRFLYCVP